MRLSSGATHGRSIRRLWISLFHIAVGRRLLDQFQGYRNTKLPNSFGGCLETYLAEEGEIERAVGIGFAHNSENDLKVCARDRLSAPWEKCLKAAAKRSHYGAQFLSKICIANECFGTYDTLRPKVANGTR